MSAGPGRNDPCPCGSGLKYKKCCLLWESVPEGAAEQNEVAPDTVLHKLVEISLKGPKYRFESFARRCSENSWLEPAAWNGLAKDRNITEDLDHCFEMLLIHSGMLPGGGDAYRLAQGKYRHLFSEEELAEVEARARGVFGFFQVRELDPANHRVLVQDIHSSDAYRVFDRAMSRSQNLGDIFPAMLSRKPHGEEFIVHPLSRRTVPSRLKRKLSSKLDRELKTANSASPRGQPAYPTLSDLLRERLELFMHAEQWSFSQSDPRRIDLRNTDGHRMLLHRVRYRVEDAEGAQAALEASANQWDESDGRLEYVWENEKRYTSHRLELDPRSGEAVLECNSKKRWKDWRQRILPAIPGLRQIELSTETMKGPAARMPGAASPPEPEFDPDTARDIAEQVYQKHLADWVDQPVPALKSKTPRQAAADPALRAALMEILDDMDYSAAKCPPNDVNHYLNSVRHRKDLGLPA